MSTDSLLLHVCCNDPDNGLFAHRAEALQLRTWDGENIEFGLTRNAPRFTELPGSIRFMRRRWSILRSTEWYGNWCWNAYELAPDIMMALLAATKKSGIFHCECAPTPLYDNWNDSAMLDGTLWMANLWGRLFDRRDNATTRGRAITWNPFVHIR